METWVRVCISSNSTCSGELPNSRDSWVSVSTFMGIRFSSSSFRGRISWVMARVSVMTKIFSSSRVFTAGKSLGILIGKGVSSQLFQAV